jgi:hypothetical protein
MDRLRRQESFRFVEQEQMDAMTVRAAMASRRVALQVHPIATWLSSKFTLERKVRLNWALVSCGSSFICLFFIT